MSEYYRAYEQRYRAVRDVGDFVWGHRTDDVQLREALAGWVGEYGLSGKRVAEFACGEGAGGVLLCSMGCRYAGYDIAPTAVEICREALKKFPDARVELRDMVNEPVEEASLDGAADISGLHMLVTDADREKYLKNVFRALKPGASALFWQEAFREDAFEGRVESIEDWMKETGLDFKTPERRRIGGTDKEVMLPLLPARPRSREGYIREFEKAGFRVVWIREIKDSEFMAMSVGILAEKSGA